MPAKRLGKLVANKPVLQKRSIIQLFDNDVDNLLSDDADSLVFLNIKRKEIQKST